MRAIGHIPLQRLLATITLILIFLPMLTSAKRSSKSADAVLLQDIKSLTFHSERFTRNRRVPAIRELTCVGGSGCKYYKPDVIRCLSSGASSYTSADVEWTCKADLPVEFKLGSTDVVCEGYDSPDDDYVLKGSCGLEYRLILTEAGQAKFGKSKLRDKWSGSAYDKEGGDFGGWLASIIFWILFIGVLFIIIRAIWRSNRDGGNRGFGRGAGGWGGGWGGGDDDNDPPPPYSPRPPRKPSTRSSWSTPQSRNQSQGWRPGFWTGTAAGAAAGYFAGNRQSQNRAPAQDPYYDPGIGSSRRPGGGFGGGGGPSFSSPTHESTGFGGTRRR